MDIALNIKDVGESDGSCTIVIVGRPDVMAIEATGVPASDAGAEQLALLLRSAALAIEREIGDLSRDTERFRPVPAETARPRFNPQPRSKQK